MKKASTICFALGLAGCSQLIGCSHFQSNSLASDGETGARSPSEASIQLSAALRPLVDPNCLVTPEELEGFPSPDYEDVWDRIRAGFQLDYELNPRIETHLNWYARNPGYMERVSERANRYMYGIVSKIEERGMPMELALLPIVESAFDPFAYSHGRASGMWQFIQATGKRYGLKKTDWYDGRRDIEAATDAALDYLEDLHKQFDGDWLLALASYNTGEGNVRRAIRRNQRAGKGTDFWSLDLPRETEMYVPQLLALVKLVQDPITHQVAINKIPNSPYYAKIDVGSQIDLAKAAEFAQIDIDELYMLNPAFNRWATDPAGPHYLLLPISQAEIFEASLREHPLENRLAWESYKVKSGDSLLLIAKRFKTEVDAIRAANNIKGNMIRAGQTLLVPIATETSSHYALSSDQRLQRTQEKSKGKPGTQKVIHKVREGDSLWKIAQTYKVSVAALAKWNAMAPRDVLRPGQQLVVWANNQPAQAKLQNRPGGNEIIRKVNYRVRKGDSLARIASKFNVNINDIAEWNSLKKNKYIHPGQRLTLMVDITRTH